MNNKNRKIILILIAAFIVAVIGGIALYCYLVPKKTTVYVFKTNAKAGDVVTEDMLTAVQADSEIFVAGASAETSTQFVTGESIIAVLKSGDSLRMDVSAGMPLTLSLLTANGGSTVEMNMDPTKIAITIPVTGITGVTNDLKSGSRVNIYVTGADDSGNYNTTLAFQSMRILTVTKDNNGALVSATIETSVEESLKLVYYSSSYNIYLGLIDSTGYEYPTMETPSFAPNATNNYIDTVPVDMSNETNTDDLAADTEASTEKDSEPTENSPVENNKPIPEKSDKE